MTEQIPAQEYECPSDAFLQVLKGKCKTTLLMLIHQKRNRFSEFQAALPTISSRMLAKQLSELRRDGLIQREVFAEVPLHVEYELTPYGQTIYPIVRAMRNWGYLHQQVRVGKPTNPAEERVEEFH